MKTNAEKLARIDEELANARTSTPLKAKLLKERQVVLIAAQAELLGDLSDLTESQRRHVLSRSIEPKHPDPNGPTLSEAEVWAEVYRQENTRGPAWQAARNKNRTDMVLEKVAREVKPKAQP
jgi:hypothetical protein